MRLLNRLVVSMASTSAGPNRKAIFNRCMIPNIPENSRGRKAPKRGRKLGFDPAIFEERFRTIERVFCLGGQVPTPAASLRASEHGPLCIQDPALHDDQPAALLSDD
jgi:hypothetical protein